MNIFGVDVDIVRSMIHSKSHSVFQFSEEEKEDLVQDAIVKIIERGKKGEISRSDFVVKEVITSFVRSNQRYRRSLHSDSEYETSGNINWKKKQVGFIVTVDGDKDKCFRLDEYDMRELLGYKTVRRKQKRVLFLSGSKIFRSITEATRELKCRRESAKKMLRPVAVQAVRAI
jgi:hypothetical protein